MPALAYLALITLNQVLPEPAKPSQALRPQAQHWVQTVTILSGGFIVTSLLWATTLAHLIDGRIRAAAAAMLAGRACSPWFGIIHSPAAVGADRRAREAVWRGSRPRGETSASANQTPYHWAAAYGGIAAILLIIGAVGRPPEDQVATPPSEAGLEGTHSMHALAIMIRVTHGPNLRTNSRS